MKEYPSIPTLPTQGSSSFAHWKRNNNMSEIYAFDKIDGSNIRAEWSSKRGFYKFGSRNRLLGSDQPIINKAEGLIKAQEAIDIALDLALESIDTYITPVVEQKPTYSISEMPNLFGNKSWQLKRKPTRTAFVMEHHHLKPSSTEV